MRVVKKIGILMLVIAVIIALFGVWLKVYNDKLTQINVNETGTCYLPDGTCLHTTSDSILYFTFGIATIIAVIGVYLLLKKKEPKRAVIKKRIIEKPVKKMEERTAEAPRTLGPEMRKMFDLIAQSDGAILQRELVMKSGMDKVKVSRILDKLEMQGLIERRRHGMSNLVVLKKK
ncbi:MarR family transcriptional regulator [archaeon]|nr:MarR family transcriptional regulator [archaeon]